MIIHYIAEENGFVVIVCKLLEQQKYSNFILKIALNLMINKLLKIPKKGEYITFKNFEKRKNKITICDLCRFRKHLNT